MPMHKIIQKISNFLYNKKHAFLWKYMFIGWTWWKTKLYKNFKVLKFWKKMTARKMTHFFTIWQKTMFNRFKISNLKCRSCVEEIILPKNMFGCPLKFTLGISRNFCIFNYKPKYSYTILCECENSPTPHALF